jgi:hypothetical protein
MTSVDAGDKSTEVIEHLSVVEELTDAMVKPNQDESWIFDNQPSQPIAMSVSYWSGNICWKVRSGNSMVRNCMLESSP